MKIAVLLTCFNRKEKTVSCLESLFRVLECYNKNPTFELIELSVFLVDDGCTDGTVDAIKEKLKEKPIYIIQGTGSLYWSRGMCLAWEESLKQDERWDFFLLLNDDVELLNNLFEELLATHQYSLKKYGSGGLYSGITTSKTDYSKMTYGGNVWINRFLGTSERLNPTGTPQLCDTVNANILMVDSCVVEKIGVFWNGYEHGASDYDYSLMARKAGFPVLITSHFCGRCDDDHKDKEDIKYFILNATFEERKKYFNHPVHSNKDQLTYIRRNVPLRYPFVYIGRFLNLYFPKLYYWLNDTIR